MGLQDVWLRIKRWNLLLSDLERLLRLVDDADDRAIVFAGKANPQDAAAKQITAAVAEYQQ